MRVRIGVRVRRPSAGGRRRYAGATVVFQVHVSVGTGAAIRIGLDHNIDRDASHSILCRAVALHLRGPCLNLNEWALWC